MSKAACAFGLMILTNGLTPAVVFADDNSPPVLKSISPKELQAPTVAVTLTKLKDVGSNIRQLLKATDALYAESMVVGTQKDTIEKSVGTIRPMIEAMKNNSDHFTSGKQGFECTNEVRVAIQPSLEEWRDHINELSVQFSELEKLMQNSSFDAKAVANSTVQLKTSIKGIDSVRRRVYRCVRGARRDYY